MTISPHRPLLRGPLDEILKIFGNNHVDPPWSHVLVLGLEAIALGAVVWCALQMVEARRAARQAKRIEESNLPLYEGARFIAGHVELAQGSNLAIRITIQQDGTQSEHKGRYSHKWTETHRDVEAAPFYVRTAGGERVRVEPPADVMLVDKLDQMEWRETTKRRRRAELVQAERAIIEGVLERRHDPELQNEGSYRAIAATGWTMKPTKFHGMRVSTESLARRHELRARALFRATIGLILVALTALAAAAPYYIRVVRGQSVVADYTGKETFTTRNRKNGVQEHYIVKVSYPGNSDQSFYAQFEVDQGDYSRLPKPPGKMWLRYVPGDSSSCALGQNSSVHISHVLFESFVVAMGLYLLLRVHRYRRWYEGHVVQEEQGALPTPPNLRFLADSVEVPAVSAAKRAAAPLVDRISADFTKDAERQD